jgi:hypothetical protein
MRTAAIRRADPVTIKREPEPSSRSGFQEELGSAKK